MYACLYRPPAPETYDDQRRNRGDRREFSGSAGSASSALNVVSLVDIAREFSPRYECQGDDLVSIDVSGLGRLFGTPRAIGDALAQDAARRGVRVHVALAGTCTAARILAYARPGVTIVARGGEADVLAPLAIGILDKVTVTPEAERLRARPRDSEAVWASWDSLEPRRVGVGPHAREESAPRELKNDDAESAVAIFRAWGLTTLGELAALPPSELAARLGQQGLLWQALARGDDVRPLVPDLAEERFDASLDLDWPIEGLEPLSFVLTRLLEPLSTRLERRDRGAAVLHVRLGLVTEEVHARRLELPAPIRDVRTLRTLMLLDLESHPPAAAIDRVTIVIDPTPGRVLQHTLFTRAVPTPEQLSTLMARLGALMGQDRIGAPVVVDSYRPGALAMRAFATDHNDQRRNRGTRRESFSESSTLENSAGSASSALNVVVNVVSALRRCRQPVPARVAIDHDRPARVTTDRRGFIGGQVTACAGPWRTSGEWWAATPEAESLGSRPRDSEGSVITSGGGAPRDKKWNRDEWDVALGDGAVYRIFRDRETDAWFIDAIVD
jgi:protein ImuB